MRRYQSDVIADLIKQYGFRYIALNPRASYRGRHDSLVNHNSHEPPMMLCQHEKIAVQIAHGYAKASGEPMVAIVHDVVGLLHSVMGIYYAYLDRAPVFVIGATGPMDEGKRRPFIDWIHTAQVQGEAVRYFTKWDYQPSSIEGVPDSFARAYSIMMSEPQGPVYLCYDAWLQEAPLETKVTLPDPGSARVPSRIAPEPAALEAAAERLRTRSRSRAAAVGAMAGPPGGVRRSQRERFRRSGPPRRDDRCAGVGRRDPFELPDRTSAQPHRGTGGVSSRRSDLRPRSSRLGEAHAFSGSCDA